MTATRREPTAEQLVARIVEEVVERVDRLRRMGALVSFNIVAQVIGEVLNEEIDGGAYVTDHVCRQLVGLADELEDKTPPAPTSKELS